MRDKAKTREQLVEELAELRQRVAVLEATGEGQRILSAVRDSVREMTSQTDIDHIKDGIRRGLAELGVPFRGMSISTVDDPANPSAIVTFHKWDQTGGWAEEEEVNWNEEYFRHVWAAGEPVYRRDLVEENTFREDTPGYGYPVRAVVDVPFANGLLAVNSPEPSAFSPEDIEALEEMALVLSAGFRRLGDLQKLSQRNRDLEEKEHLLSAFHQIGRITLSTLDQDQILDTLAEQIIRAGIFRSLMIALVREELQQVEVVRTYACITDGKLTPGESIRVSDRPARTEEGQLVATDRQTVGTIYDLNEENITADVARNGEMQVIAGWSDRFDDNAGPAEDREGQVAYFIPVKQEGRVLAILATGSEIAEREEILRRIDAMQPLLDQVAITLEHARLYESIQRGMGERQRVEDELRVNEERFRLLAESSPLGTALISPKGEYLYTNPAFTNLFGYTLEDIPTGRDWFEKAFPDAQHRERVIKVWKDDMREAGVGESRPRIFSAVCKDGSVKDVHFRPVTMSNGAQLISYEDITTRRRMEEEIQRAHNLESLGILAGGIAHDFNNVLTGVMGNLGLLERLLDKDSMEHEVALDAQQAASKTKRLTEQLMTFATGGAPAKEVSSIEKLVRETTRLSLHGANTKPVFQFTKGLLCVEIDPGQIGQVIQNLVLNADQAMPNGGTLKISGENVEVGGDGAIPVKRGTYVRVSIEDEGIGIPENILGQVFDPYFSTKETGHGLGLAICYSIVQRHDGHMTVVSEQGVGSTFMLYLPASQEQVATTVEQKRGISVGTGSILLMDDEETIHRMVGRTLRVLGYEVESVYDGHEALTRYGDALEADRPFDVVIMDLTVPGGMGGKEAIGRLLEMDSRARVLVSSGYANDPVMADYAGHGFSGRVGKPVDVDELAATVSRVLSERPGHTAVPSTSAEGMASGPFRVLLVDDDEAIVKAISWTLADLGHTVLTAGTGESAVAMYREKHAEIDAVVLDYSLPKMSGREALMKMREIDPRVRVLLATGHGSSSEVQELLELGAESLLSKPYGIGELVRRLEQRD